MVIASLALVFLNIYSASNTRELMFQAKYASMQDKIQVIASSFETADTLSAREYQLMELFLRSPGMLFSAERLMEKIWGWDSEAEINVIWVNISNLRKKLKTIGSHVQINASRGLGYLLETGK